MKFYSAVENAVKLVSDILEANHITETTDSIRSKVYSWYNNSDICDPETLAGCALNGYYYPEATYKDMLAAKDYWFPQDPHECASVWDIELSMRDIAWR